MQYTDPAMEGLVRKRLEAFHQLAPDSIGDMLCFRLLGCDCGAGEYLFTCRTLPWMRNVNATLHGGICATILDQAMGFIAHCVMQDAGVAPTIQLQLNYHRPLLPGEEVLVKVKVLSATKSLIHLSAQAAWKEQPDKICVSGTGISFCKYI